MGWQACAYRALSFGLPAIAAPLLRRRLARGKEDPARWREKLGYAGQPRPDGHLIWLHAVGLGEVLALRGLVHEMGQAHPDWHFLITSTARSSAQALGGQLPPRSIHQFLPLDAPQYLTRFLAHWRPALSIWAEQDLWPGAVIAADRAGVPLAMVNARMNDAAFAKRAKARGLYADLLARFRLIAAQDDHSAANLTALGAHNVRVTGPLKAAAPPLICDAGALSRLKAMTSGRKVWLLASSHPEDEALALAAQKELSGTGALLLIAPRDPSRGPEIAAAARDLGLRVSLRSKDEDISSSIYICDTFGEMGLWYRLADTSLIGGTFSAIEGHNPWEPAALGSAILHGPRVANFRSDFAQLHDMAAAEEVTANTLVAALEKDHHAMAVRAKDLAVAAQGSLAPLVHDLAELVAL